ncbi:MAG: DUF262 domain-containing protein [candidate division WOR-3 bacterium]|jgi:hypothetical protein|nr:DUF262 domain-containing HNH endonuclease family protein [candidate division WOR-3 bacterium]MDH7519691.1 DUF262 domain-containing protein [bacterium]
MGNHLLKNISELFTNKVFKIPDYQRNYAWTDKNWEDFWNDIREGLLTKTAHYWGTITLKATEESRYCTEKDIPYNLYEVVDGQQRITTIYLFLLALSRAGKPALRDNFIKCGDIYRVELGGLNNQFLKDLVDGRDPNPDIKTNRRLRDCLNYFENQIRSFVQNNELSELSKYIQNNTFCLEFIVQDSFLAVKAFESLNDRGKPLTLLDKTKSYLMFISMKHLKNGLNEKIKSTFGNIFTYYDRIKEIGEQESITYLSRDRFTEDELLRFFYHYFAFYAIQRYKLNGAYDYDATADNVFEIFLKGSCNQLKNTPADLGKFIEEFLDGLEKFACAFKNVIERVNTDCRYKKLFSFLGLNTRVYPLIISLETEGKLSDSTLELIETLDLRVYKIRGTEPRAGLYINVIAKIKSQPNIQLIEEGIRAFIKEFMPDTLFQHTLNQPIYNNPATKFILWEYEKHRNSSFNDCDSSLYKDCQIEHIFAQNPRFAFPAYEFNNEGEYLENIHRLGNLCLLESNLNALCQDNLPEQKARYYQRSNIPRTRDMGCDISNRRFDRNKIDQITEDIIKFCLDRWRLNV